MFPVSQEAIMGRAVAATLSMRFGGSNKVSRTHFCSIFYNCLSLCWPPSPWPAPQSTQPGHTSPAAAGIPAAATPDGPPLSLLHKLWFPRASHTPKPSHFSSWFKYHFSPGVLPEHSSHRSSFVSTPRALTAKHCNSLCPSLLSPVC